MPGSTRLGLVGGGTISPGQMVLASVATPDVSATAGSGTVADVRIQRILLLLDPPRHLNPKDRLSQPVVRLLQPRCLRTLKVMVEDQIKSLLP